MPCSETRENIFRIDWPLECGSKKFATHVADRTTLTGENPSRRWHFMLGAQSVATALRLTDHALSE